MFTLKYKSGLSSDPKNWVTVFSYDKPSPATKFKTGFLSTPNSQKWEIQTKPGSGPPYSKLPSLFPIFYISERTYICLFFQKMAEFG